jgi:hypothetical protein
VNDYGLTEDRSAVVLSYEYLKSPKQTPEKHHRTFTEGQFASFSAGCSKVFETLGCLSDQEGEPSPVPPVYFFREHPPSPLQLPDGLFFLLWTQA